MLLKQYAIQLVFRTILLLISLCVLTYLIFFLKFWFSILFVILLIIVQLYSLFQFSNQTNRDLAKLFYAIKHEDYSVYFKSQKKGKIFKELYSSLNQLIKLFEKNRIEKEANFQHFKTIFEHIGHGIITIKWARSNDNGEIILINKAASRILKTVNPKYWHRFKEQQPIFCSAVNDLRNGGKRQVTLKSGNENIQIALEVIKIKVLDENYIIVSFQDIKSEMEKKETEAWYKLIRVLAHEMLNSFTPVSSLAETIKDLAEKSFNIPNKKLSKETIEEIHLAATTIKRRSESLMGFVNDYRLLTEMPYPDFKPHNINELFEHIAILMQAQIKEQKINFVVKKAPKMATIFIDNKMVEQVMINLISNSIHSVEGMDDPQIILSFDLEENNSIISVSDNGPGIPKDIIDKIFIPFYTTKKKGSGIGLSLTKNIMNVHNGRIRVSSTKAKTVISLIFNNDLNKD